MFLLVKVMNSANNENMCRDVRRCDYLEGEGYLFDTNIWIHTIYMPYIYNSTEYMDVYGRMLINMISRKCNIYTNTMILSEFANKISRHEFNISKEKLGLKATQYKIFRETENYKETTSLVANCIRKIAKFTKICDLNRDDNDLLYELADDFASENYDFNDMVFAKICKENKLTFVTHDEDFKNYGIKVITANRSLLKSN